VLLQPAGYRRKLANYRLFRRNLGLPLAAVELAFGSAFELEEEDAEILIRRRGADVMWQKERLLNLALDALPPDCRVVAWLDCDVVFERDDWPDRAERHLEHAVLVQPFSHIYEVPREAGPDQDVDFLRPARAAVQGRGIARALRDGAANIFDLRTIQTSGLAWTARRDLLRKHGFYDGCILGGGDRALLAAAVGDFDGPARAWRWNASQAEHYRRWAEPFFRAVRARVDFVEGGVFHLWHGERRYRRYRSRLWGLAGLGFDPFGDVALDEAGCWKWASEKTEVRDYVSRYFASRNEDG
jgi:hypothetical protein